MTKWDSHDIRIDIFVSSANIERLLYSRYNNSVLSFFNLMSIRTIEENIVIKSDSLYGINTHDVRGLFYIPPYHSQKYMSSFPINILLTTFIYR